jgi:uncharacterized repeat protein (TIGR01451 family)
MHFNVQPHFKKVYPARLQYRILIAALALLLAGIFFQIPASVSAQIDVKAAKKGILLIDRDGDGRPSPGDTIRYEVVIENTGSQDATGVEFNDPLDPNTELVAGSVSLIRQPTAVPDSFSTQFNTPFSTVPAQGLLENDDTQGALLTSFGGGDLGGTVADHSAGVTVAPLPAFTDGSLTIKADGALTINPPTGFSGLYNFEYRLENLAGISDAAVTIAVRLAPSAVNDSPADNSRPGDDFHAAFETLIAGDILANDALGFPAAALTSFGGGDLGGAVNDNAADSFVAFGAGSLQVNTDGRYTFTPAANFTGLITFEYRVENLAGSDDGSVTLAVGDRPQAVDDARDVTGNVRIDTKTIPFSLLNNDAGDGLTVATADATSTAGGQVSVRSDGTFTYNPPPGFEGRDTFTYTPKNGFGEAPAPATVTLTVNDMIWFIDNDPGAVAGNDGRLSSPFRSLADLEALNGNGGANDPKAGDSIFIDETGSGSYTGGLILENDQILIGRGAGESIAAIAGITPAAGSASLPVTGGAKPIITNAGGNGITLADNNAIHGIIIANGGQHGIFGQGFSGGLTVRNCEINNHAADGLHLENLNAIMITLADLIIADNAGDGIELKNVDAALNLTDVDFSNNGGAEIRIDGGAPNATFSGDLTNDAGYLVDVTNTIGGTLNFNFANITGSGGSGIRIADAAGNVTVDKAILSGSSGIDIQGGSGTFSFTNAEITDVSGTAFRLSGGSAVTTYSGAITNSSGGLIAIDGLLSGGSVTFSAGTVMANQGSSGITIIGSGGSINVADYRAGTPAARLTSDAAVLSGNTGTTTFTDLALYTSGQRGIASDGGGLNIAAGTVDTDGALALELANTDLSAALDTVTVSNPNGGGIYLNANTGSLNMVDLAITTTNGTGLYASNAGRLLVTGANNTVNTTDGVAVHIKDTDIDSGGMIFAQVNANGAANGILLDNTGGNGGFRITGDGLDTTRGGNGTGGVIQSTTGHGIVARNVTDFKLASLKIDNPQGAAPGGNGILLEGISGTCEIKYCTVTGINRLQNSGLYIKNRNSELADLTVADCIFSDSASGQAMVLLEAYDNAQITFTIENSLFTGLMGDATNINAGMEPGDQPQVTHFFRNNTIEDAAMIPNQAADGLSTVNAGIAYGGSADVTITGNLLRNIGRPYFNAGLINTGVFGLDNTGGTLTAVISNNTIANSSGRRGINVVSDPSSGAPTLDITIDNNDIDRLPAKEAVFVDLRDNTGDATVRITNNRIGQLAGYVGEIGGSRPAVRLRSSGLISKTVTAAIDNNTVTAAASNRLLDIESEDNSTLNVTITDNTLTTSNASGVEIDLDSEDDGSSDGTPSTLCSNIFNNTLAGGSGTIRIDEDPGSPAAVHNVVQLSAANMASVNGIPAGNIVVVGTPNFGQAACPTPKP